MIDYQDGVVLYKASGAEKKKFYKIKESEHTQFIYDEPDKYKAVIESFIEE